MNFKQLQWARTHDWYVDYTEMPDGTYMVHTRSNNIDDKCTFDNFNELYIWAGY